MIFGEHSDIVENDIAKISRRLQIFVLQGLSGMQMFQDAETVADVPKKTVCFVEMVNKLLRVLPQLWEPNRRKGS